MKNSLYHKLTTKVIILFSLFLIILILPILTIIKKTRLINNYSWMKKQYKANSIKFNENQSKKLPILYINKNKIITKDKRMKIVILKGVTTQAFGYFNYPLEIFWQRFAFLKQYGINVLGAYITPLTINDKLEDIDKLVAETEKNRIYLFFYPLFDDTIKAERLKKNITDLPEFLSSLAKRYKRYSHIFYGIWTEPREITWNEYIRLLKKTIELIRKENSQSLILISGINWGAHFYNFSDLKKFNNVILDYHYYVASNDSELKKFVEIKENFKNFPWMKAVNEFPILIGEFGGVWNEDFSSDTDLFFIKEILNNINENGLNYTFYTIDPLPYQPELSLFKNNTLQLSKKGKLLINDLRNFPPTQF